MGSPNTPTTVDPIAFLLEEQEAVQLPPLGPEDCFRVLEGMVQKAQPYFRDLFHWTFQQVLENLMWRVGRGTWKTLGEIPDLPPQLTKSTKCLGIPMPIFPSRMMRFVILTRNARMFLLYVELREAEQPVYRVTPLSKEVFLEEWEGKHRQLLRHVNWGLSQRFGYVNDALRDRLEAYRKMQEWHSRLSLRLPSD